MSIVFFIIGCDAPRLQVIEQPAALADHLQQAEARVVVVLMGAEMPRQLVDERRQQRDLDFGSPRIIGGFPVLLHDFLFLLFCERHGSLLLYVMIIRPRRSA
jgi:hypothetical protein